MTGPFDDEYWRAFRARARKRTSAQMALFIAPLGIFVTIVKILEPQQYPAGDVRNSMEFRLLFYGVAIILLIALLVGSLRWLIADRRGPG